MAFEASTFCVIPSLEKQARNNSVLVGSRPKITCFNNKKKCIYANKC